MLQIFISETLKFHSFNDTILLQTEDKRIFSKKNFRFVSKKKPNNLAN